MRDERLGVKRFSQQLGGSPIEILFSILCRGEERADQISQNSPGGQLRA